MIEINNICKEFQKELVLDHINAIFFEENEDQQELLERNGRWKKQFCYVILFVD